MPRRDAFPPHASAAGGDGAWLPRASTISNFDPPPSLPFIHAATPAPPHPARHATDWSALIVSIALVVIAGLALLLPP